MPKTLRGEDLSLYLKDTEKNMKAPQEPEVYRDGDKLKRTLTPSGEVWVVLKRNKRTIRSKVVSFDEWDTGTWVRHIPRGVNTRYDNIENIESLDVEDAVVV